MDPKELKENFSTQLEKLDREIGQLRQALAQRQELAVKLQGAIEAMNLQLGETVQQGAEPEAVTEAVAEVATPES
jgi:regulator of replication initiation timing